MVISGDMIQYFKSSKQTFDALSKITTASPILADSNKKSIKMNLKFENTDNVVVGLRIKMEGI